MTKKRVLFAAKSAVSLGLLAWVVHTALVRDGVTELARRFETIGLSFVALALVFHFGAVFSGIARWRLLLEARGLRAPLAFLTRTYLIGRFIGAFTPSTIGLDVHRAIEVGRRTGQRGASASVIVVEKLVGLLGLAIVTATLLGSPAGAMLGPQASGVAALVALGSVLGLVALRFPSVMSRATRALPKKLRGRALSLVDAVSATHLTVSAVARAVALGVASHVSTALVFVATAWALGLPLDALSLLALGNAIIVATLLPISVGGVGVREGVAVVMLGALGVSATDATLVAVLGYLTGQAPAILGGILQVLDRPEPLVEGGRPRPALES